MRGRTPLHDALARGAGLGVCLTGEVANKGVLAALLRGGASARCRDCRGDTPLGYALDGNNAGALAALLADEKLRRAWRAELSHELRRLFRRYLDGEEVCENFDGSLWASAHAAEGPGECVAVHRVGRQVVWYA